MAFITETRSYVAPRGTVTVNEVVVAAVTVAIVAPKYTISLAIVSLKLVPVIVTLFNGMAGLGDIDVIVGNCAWAVTLVSANTANKDLSMWLLQMCELRVILFIKLGF